MVMEFRKPRSVKSCSERLKLARGGVGRKIHCIHEFQGI